MPAANACPRETSLVHPSGLAVVRAVQAVTRRVRRLVLGGDHIAAFAPPSGALGPYVKLCLKTSSGEPCLRTYSIRRFDAERSELHIDVVRHAGTSVGCIFAEQACPGTSVRLGGMGFIPADQCGRYLLAGDHTALPAIAHILETLPAGPEVQAVIEVPDRAEEQELKLARSTRVIWLCRDPGAPSRLAETVRAICPAATDDLLVWAGAEAEIARSIRRFARWDRGIPAKRCQVLNYWKQGRPEGGFSYVA